MDVRALPADLAARRFERERAEVAKHKPHVLAPEDISADAVSEADGHVDRSKARDPREERKGKPKHPSGRVSFLTGRRPLPARISRMGTTS